MHYRRGSILVAGLLLGLLLMLASIGLPYDRLDWMVYSQPYEPTQTPTGTSPPIATFTPTSTATRTATATMALTLTPPATATAIPTIEPESFYYLPLILRPLRPVRGSVEIEGGACCVGGTVGDTIDIHVAYEAASPFSDVTEMRTGERYGGGCLAGAGMTHISWEPFVSARTFPLTVAINWIGFYVSVQYRDAAGYVSPIYCDDISVEGEGMPPLQP